MKNSLASFGAVSGSIGAQLGGQVLSPIVAGYPEPQLGSGMAFRLMIRALDNEDHSWMYPSISNLQYAMLAVVRDPRVVQMTVTTPSHVPSYVFNQ